MLPRLGFDHFGAIQPTGNGSKHVQSIHPKPIWFSLVNGGDVYIHGQAAISVWTRGYWSLTQSDHVVVRDTIDKLLRMSSAILQTFGFVWNIRNIPNYSHSIGIMISKTIGFRGTLFSDTPIWCFHIDHFLVDLVSGLSRFPVFGPFLASTFELSN